MSPVHNPFRQVSSYSCFKDGNFLVSPSAFGDTTILNFHSVLYSVVRLLFVFFYSYLAFRVTASERDPCCRCLSSLDFGPADRHQMSNAIVSLLYTWYSTLNQRNALTFIFRAVFTIPLSQLQIPALSHRFRYWLAGRIPWSTMEPYYGPEASS